MKKYGKIILACAAAAVIAGCGTTAQLGPIDASVSAGVNGKVVDASVGYTTNGVLTVGGTVQSGTNAPVGGTVSVNTK